MTHCTVLNMYLYEITVIHNEISLITTISFTISIVIFALCSYTSAMLLFHNIKRAEAECGKVLTEMFPSCMGNIIKNTVTKLFIKLNKKNYKEL